MSEEQEGIDFNQPLLGINDKPIEGEDGEDRRLGNFCVNALLSSPQGDKADGVQKLKRWNLARKIQGKAGDDEPFAQVRLNSKQKKMILDIAEDVFSTLVYARLYEALEGTTKEEDEE